MAVLAVGAVAASEASATPHWVINGSSLASGSSETVLGLLSLGDAQLEATIGGIATDILCLTAHATGTITGPSTDEASAGILFSECTVPHPTGCSTTSQIKVVSLTSALLTETNEAKTVGYDTWTPKEGTEFVTIPITGSACSVEGSYKVTGKAQCEGALNVEAEAFACLFGKNSKSELKLGSNAADFLAHFLFLLTGTDKDKVWGVGNP
jgi:hypothetical protein